MKPILSLCLFAAALTSCSSYSLVNSELYDEASLPTVHTFRIITPDEGSMPQPMAVSVYNALDSAITHEMTQHGFNQDDNSCYLVNIGMTVHRTSSGQPSASAVYTSAPGPYYDGVYPVFVYPRSAYYDYYDCPVCDNIFKEGVLTIDLVDLDNHELVYTASVTAMDEYGDWFEPGSPEMTKAVSALFSKLPVFE